MRHVAEGRGFNYMSDIVAMNTGNTRRLPPIATRPHGDGAAIIGGLVVHDRSGLPDLVGSYVFDDFVQGTMAALEYEDGIATVTPLLEEIGSVVSFGRDEGGAILAVSITGTVYQIVDDTS